MTIFQEHHTWLLRVVLDRATRLGKTRDAKLAEALAETAAAAWSAARYLEALALVDPAAAMRIAKELDFELESGDYLETAADLAERLNIDVAGWVEAARRAIAEESAS
jgi:hypothetical protein